MVLGGPSTIRAFSELGVVGTLEIQVLPILVGSGLSLFPLGDGQPPSLWSGRSATRTAQ